MAAQLVRVHTVHVTNNIISGHRAHDMEREKRLEDYIVSIHNNNNNSYYYYCEFFKPMLVHILFH